MQQPRFNSNLVRLLVVLLAVPCGYILGFNSNLVRLLVFVRMLFCVLYRCFNSNLVRLLALGAVRNKYGGDWFQFQSGAITGDSVLDEDITQMSFNSNLVRLLEFSL